MSIIDGHVNSIGGSSCLDMGIKPFIIHEIFEAYRLPTTIPDCIELEYFIMCLAILYIDQKIKCKDGVNSKRIE